MRLISKGAPARTLFLLMLVLFSAWAARAQASQDDKRNATSFIDSMASTVYKMAWPTATYREVGYEGFEAAPNGFDVLVRLSGQSAFDNSDLWLTLAFMFRDGKFYDIQVRDNNAILVPPFATTRTIGSVALALAKEYSDDQKTQQVPDAAQPSYTPPPPPTYNYSPPSESPAHTPPPPADSGAATVDPDAPSAEGACLQNPTDDDIQVNYQWGDAPSTQFDMKPHTQEEIWWDYKAGGSPSPQLLVRYEDASVSPAEQRAYNLKRTPSKQPPACEDLQVYHFGKDGADTVIYTGSD